MSNRNSQPRSASSLNGNAPDRSNAVLILVDVINDLDFPTPTIGKKFSCATGDWILSCNALMGLDCRELFIAWGGRIESCSLSLR